MLNSVISVSQLNFYIRNILESDEILNSVFVKGEISNFVHHSSGHLYLSLKDENALIKGVMFKNSAGLLKFLPENGMKVIVHGRVSLFERDGQYQIYIDDIQPDGAGALSVAFEQLKNKLSQEGLFDEKFKKTIPAFSKRIAVITSKTGAAVRDIINVISRRCSFCNVVVCPIPVQGEGAYKLIASAVEYVNSKKLADLIIIARGGGSTEDLWNFNEEELARAVFSSDIPVISGVGHETDFTICDFVADLRAPTPSAAAELATPLTNEVFAMISDCRKRIINSAFGKVENCRIRLDKYNTYVLLKRLNNEIDKQKNNLIFLNQKMKQAVDKKYSMLYTEFEKNVEKLILLNPMNVFSKGYSAVSSAGVLIKSVDELNISDEVEIRLSDGKAKAVITKKEKNNG